MVKHRHILRFSEYDADADATPYFALAASGTAIVVDNDPYWKIQYAIRVDRNGRTGFSTSDIDAYIETIPDVHSKHLYSFGTTAPSWAPESFTPSNGDDIKAMLTLTGQGPWGLSVPAQSTPSVDVLGYLTEQRADGTIHMYSSYSSALTYSNSSFTPIRAGSTVTGVLLLDYQRGGNRYYDDYYIQLSKSSYTLEEVQDIELNWVATYDNRALIGSGSMRAS